MSVIALPLLAYLIIQNNSVQNYLASKITHKLSDLFGTKVTVQHVHMNMLNQLVLDSVFIEDIHKDTLIFSPKLTLAIEAINFKKNIIRIDKVELENPYVHFFVDSSNYISIEHIVDKISGPDTTEGKWDVQFNNIGMNDGLFYLDFYNKPPDDSSINFKNMRLNHLNIRIKNLRKQHRVVSFKINKLAFAESSGFNLDFLSAKMSIGKKLMHFSDMHIVTAKSDINAPKLFFDFKRIKEFKDFAQKVTIDFEFKKTKASLSDIGYFVSSLYGYKQDFKLEGTFKGKLSDLRCRNITFSTGKATRFRGNINSTGLPNIHETYLYLDSKELTLNQQDIEQFYIPGIENNHLEIPDILKKFEFVKFKGSFTGFINDFVTYGTFQTAVGIIRTDISLKPQSKNLIEFKGELTAKDLNVAKFSNKNFLGKASFHLNANGQIEDYKKVTGYLNGSIDNIDVFKYNYSNININGALDNNIFQGFMGLNDPNLKFSIQGQFDFNDTVPIFDFVADLPYANLKNLKLLDKDSSTIIISAYAKANFKGKNLETSDGIITVPQFDITKKNKKLSIKDFVMKTSGTPEDKTITISSNVANIDIKGYFDYSTLENSLKESLRKYLPGSLYSTISKTDKEKQLNNFSFKITCNETENLFHFFNEDFSLSKQSTFSGNYNASTHKSYIKISSEKLCYKSVVFNNLNITTSSNNNEVTIKAFVKQAHISEQIKLSRFNTTISGYSDTLKCTFYWYDNEKSKLRNNLRATSFYSYNESAKPILNFRILPATFVLLDSVWKIDESNIIIDSSSIFVNNLNVTQNNQKFKALGTISENPSDSLTISFENFSLRNVLVFSKNDNVNIEGVLNGRCKISDFYHTKKFDADLLSEELRFNNQNLGKTIISSHWDDDMRKLQLAISCEQEGKQKIHLQGNYAPENQKIDFDFNTYKLPLDFLKPIIKGTVSAMGGKGSAEIKLSGTTTKPEINGFIDVDTGKIYLAPLNTTYSFNTRIFVTNNILVFKDAQINDKNGNHCKLNGSINPNPKNINLNLNISLANVLVLNTLPDENNSFYGTAYASGNIKISGIPDDLTIDISNAQTEKNTFFYIPLNRKGDVAENNYITFVNKNAPKAKIAEEPVNKHITGLTLSMDLDITPEAEIQLIFDEKAGDIMRGKGAGSLKIDLSKTGIFTMRGEYTIESGDYLFTLQNVINKKFIVDKGGTIAWNGPPTDAIIDIKAVYKTKAALYNLLTEVNVATETNEEYKKRIPVECQLFMTGKLLKPDIRYDISLPSITEETRNKVRNAINNEEELSKQFLALLVISNFYPDPNIQQSTTTGSYLSSNAVKTTSYELLSNQFSNWLSQLSNDFDIGFSYRPGDANITKDEVEVALSTQLLNDRLSINGNFDVLGNQNNNNVNNKNNTNSIVGDVNVEYKLNESGKLKLKAFNRVNEQLLVDQAPYTQGVGIFYREEFSTFSELRKKYYKKLFQKKKEEAKNK